jgi:hypothetical protein
MVATPLNGVRCFVLLQATTSASPRLDQDVAQSKTVLCGESTRGPVPARGESGTAGEDKYTAFHLFQVLTSVGSGAPPVRQFLTISRDSFGYLPLELPAPCPFRSYPPKNSEVAQDIRTSSACCLGVVRSPDDPRL